MTWPQFGKRKPIERRVVVAVKAPVGPDGTIIEIDEKYMAEWVEFGWVGPSGIDEYLAKHAAFAAWEAAHNQEEHDDPALD